MRTLFVIVAAVLLAACQSIVSDPYAQNENSPYFVVPAGSLLALNQELAIPANQVGIFIQDGQVVPVPQVKQYYPYCKFQMYTLAENARKVAPDNMTIVRTVQEEIEGPSTAADRIHYASRSSFRLASMGGNGGPSAQAFSTRMELRANTQTDIFRLTCSQWGYSGTDRHVTIMEIRKTLGNMFTLRLAGSGR